MEHDLNIKLIYNISVKYSSLETWRKFPTTFETVIEIPQLIRSS